jgi:DNA-binding NarL/FixJ family response regulator
VRTRFLPAHVEVMIAARDLEEARRAADELMRAAEALRMEMLSAIADHAHGAVLLATGDARAAIDPLRASQEAWQRMGARYLSARVRASIACAFAALGDEDGAQLERAAARKVFVEVGAAPDAAACDAAAAAEATARAAAGKRGATAAGDHTLSPRELDVLRLLATGKTNKEIGRALFVSEKTVDRHVSNMFTKLGVHTRAAATSWAHRRGLVG